MAESSSRRLSSGVAVMRRRRCAAMPEMQRLVADERSFRRCASPATSTSTDDPLAKSCAFTRNHDHQMLRRLSREQPQQQGGGVPLSVRGLLVDARDIRVRPEPEGSLALPHGAERRGRNDEHP
eukprot:1505171-Prymnesium_polylepis.1